MVAEALRNCSLRLHSAISLYRSAEQFFDDQLGRRELDEVHGASCQKCEVLGGFDTAQAVKRVCTAKLQCGEEAIDLVGSQRAKPGSGGRSAARRSLGDTVLAQVVPHELVA